MAGDATSRILFSGSRFRLGAFTCGPDSARWREINDIGDVPHVVFAGTNVVIRQLGREPVLVNWNHVVFYDGGQRYLRRLVDPAGDRCLYVELDPSLLTELVGEDEFRFTHGPLPAQHRLLLALVERESSHRLDELAAEEIVLDALAAAAEAAVRSTGRRASRAATDLTHADLVETAKEILAADPARRVSLGALAQQLHVSEFHLARLFRARTGFTLRGYRNHLRLRLAVERLADRDVDLTQLAVSLGYAGHSHFTDSFTAVFGVPPSVVRDRGRAVLRQVMSSTGPAGYGFARRSDK